MTKTKRSSVNFKRLQQYMQTLPELRPGKCKGVAIEASRISAGTVEPVVSMRNAIMMGLKPCSIKHTENTVRHKLVSKEHGTWMTDSPQEVWQMDEPLRKCHGRILVGGLGLGIFPSLAAAKGHTVVCIERDERVISLIKPSGFRIIHDDIYEYAKRLKPGQYDCAFMDTWQGTGEYVWATEVVPLLRLLRPKIPNIWCWNEREMHGQMMNALPRFASLPISEHQSNGHVQYRPFAIVAQQKRLTAPWQSDFHKMLEMADANQSNRKFMKLLKLYLECVGTPEWEELFGKHWPLETPKET